MTKNLTSKFPGTCKACGCHFPAGENIIWTQGAGARHATLQQCTAAKNSRAAAVTPKMTIDLKPIADFLLAAQKRGLKAPKLRVLAPDGRSEMRLGVTKGGVAPGSISVVIADDFIGCIRPDGSIVSAKLAARTDIHTTLLRVAQDPATAAKEYAALMGLCSFCGLPLTDAGSVEVGYGPVCAKHWGLPHSPKGTPVLSAGPVGQQRLV